jgi:hypothetical protein
MTRRGRGRSPFSLFSFQDIITCVSGIIILITLMLAVELSQRKQGSPRIQTAQLAAKLREAIADAQAEAARLEAWLKRGEIKAEELAGVSVSALQHDLFAVNEQIKSLEAEIASLQKQAQAVAEKDEKLQAKRFDREKDDKKRAEEELKVSDLEKKLLQVRHQNRVFYNPRMADGKQVWLVQIEGDRVLVAPAGSTARPNIFSQRFSMFQQSGFEKWLTNRSPAADFFFLLVRPDGINEFSELRKILIRRGFSIGFDLIGPGQSAVDPEKGAAGP